MPRGHVLPDGPSVAALRGEAGLTQDELAARAGYGLRTIGNIEGGRPTTANTLTAIATVLAARLERPVQLSDLLVRRRHDDRHATVMTDGIAFQDNVRFLELPPANALASGGRGRSHKAAVLTETAYLRSPLKQSTEILFFYPGTSVEGGSVSHSHAAQWLASGDLRRDSATASVPERFRVLRLNVDNSVREGTLVQNRVEWSDGYLSARHKSYHAHIAYPTECLTMLVKFPEGSGFAELRGSWRHRGQAPFVPANSKPLALVPGSLAYWHISSARPGETYQLSWA